MHGRNECGGVREEREDTAGLEGKNARSGFVEASKVFMAWGYVRGVEWEVD